MSRVPYVAAEPIAGESELVTSIRARRGGKLLNLDRMLLNSPAFARGWNGHLGAVRKDLALDPKLRELAVCAVAVLNDAEYEFEQHEPEWRNAGASGAQVVALRKLVSGAIPAGFDAVESAVLQLTVEMTRSVKVSDGTFERARALLGDERLLVELVGVVATYNMVSRFLVALAVDLEVT